MVHQRQRLAFGFEPRDDLASLHAELDDFQRNAAADRLLLLGEIDDTHAAFAEPLQNPVRPDLLRVDEGPVRWRERCLETVGHADRASAKGASVEGRLELGAALWTQVIGHLLG